MEKKMETTRIYWDYIGDNGKENGNCYNGVIHTVHLNPTP